MSMGDVQGFDFILGTTPSVSAREALAQRATLEKRLWRYRMRVLIDPLTIIEPAPDAFEALTQPGALDALKRITKDVAERPLDPDYDLMDSGEHFWVEE